MTEWRVIPSVPDYEASDDGQVRRRFPGKCQRGTARPLAQHPGNRGGYLKVALWVSGRVRQHWLHRLVCEAFNGPPPSPVHQAAHNNGVPTDCRAENLRWVDRRENYQDNIRHGTSRRGEGNPAAILSEAKVIEIRQRYGALQRSVGGARKRKGATEQLAQEYGVTAATVRNIANSRSWRHA